MSASVVRVGELVAELEKYPSDMPVVTVWPGWETWEAKVEGNLDGPDHFEVVTAQEVRSGWFYPPEPGTENTWDVLVMSDVGVGWLADENRVPERERLARKLCEHHKVDPDKETVGIGRLMPKGQRYKLWECWATHYVDVLTEES